MAKTISNVQNMLVDVQMNWVNVFEPSSAVPGADPKFSVQSSFAKDSETAQHILAIQDQIGEAVWVEQWPQVKRQLEAQG